MDSKSIRREMYRSLVELGRARFGAEDWARKIASYATRPKDFAWKVLGSRWWSAQEEVGAALVRNRRVAVRSGNGVGKTYLAADLALWFLYTQRPAVVVTSAPTWRQVKHVLWHEIRRRFGSSRVRLPGKLLKTGIDLDNGSFALGLSTDGGVQFQGFHCENLLIILDEASGVEDEIWDAAEGVAVGGNNRILAIGNPLRTSGRFYDLFKRASGWHKVTINGLLHPNVTGHGRRIPGCVTEEFIDEKVIDWCEPVPGMSNVQCPMSNADAPDAFLWKGRRYLPNDLFRGRVLGAFPRSADSALIPLFWIEAAVARRLPVEGVKRVAADVARFGDDWTVIGVRVGPVAVRVIPIHGADTMEVAGAIRCLAYSEQPASIAVDSIGMGAGVVDKLWADGIVGVEAVNSSERAHDPEHFANRRAELYWGLRERFRSGEIQISADELLVEELASVRYKVNARGQIQIESKEEMKKRVKRSPDRADMLAMLFDGAGDWMARHDVPQPIRPSEAAVLRAEMADW